MNNYSKYHIDYYTSTMDFEEAFDMKVGLDEDIYHWKKMKHFFKGNIILVRDSKLGVDYLIQLLEDGLIKIEELCKRLSAKVRSTMDEVYSDDLIGFGWQINEEDFLRDVKNYVGDKFDDGDYCLKKEIVEEVIYDGLLKLDEFMKDHYMCEYENNNGDEVQTNLREAIIELEIDSFKKEWKLEEINKEWTYDDKKDDDFLGYDFSDEEDETTYEDYCDWLN